MQVFAPIPELADQSGELELPDQALGGELRASDPALAEAQSGEPAPTALHTPSSVPQGAGPIARGKPSEWYFLDPQGTQQGPFAASDMRDWFERGYFKPTAVNEMQGASVRAGGTGDFSPLRTMFPDVSKAFLNHATAMPRSPASAPAPAPAPLPAPAPPAPAPPAPAPPAPAPAPALALAPASEWYFLDPQGAQQGPFPPADMRDWFVAGYFKPTAQNEMQGASVRAGGTGAFLPLRAMFPNVARAFVDVPPPRREEGGRESGVPPPPPPPPPTQTPVVGSSWSVYC